MRAMVEEELLLAGTAELRTREAILNRSSCWLSCGDH